MRTTTIRERYTAYSWSRDAATNLSQELVNRIDQPVTIPLEPGGWWHEYACPTHHTELLFDPIEEDAYQFVCPYGCKHTGEPYRGAWLVFKHQSMARYALQAAALFASNHEEKYANYAKSILIQYAIQFPQYPVHPDAQPWMLKGRAFHQALTEALWSTTLIRAYLLLKDSGITLDEKENEHWLQFIGMLEQSMEQYRAILIYERNNPESNYTAWLNASLSCVYAIQGNQEKLQGLLSGEGGFHHHLSIGVKSDQLEFEGSTYYHIFVLRAYLITAEMASRFGINLYQTQGEQGQSLEGMFDVLVKLANDVGELPALHDGPYMRVPYAREIAEIFEIGLSVYGHSSYHPILAEVYRFLYGASSGRAGLEPLLYGTGEWDGRGSHRYGSRGSVLLEPSGFAVLRQPNNPLSAWIDFGEHGGSHGHDDKLHVTIQHAGGAVSPELGMVPYGSKLRKEWFRVTASHNTVSINGHSQAAHTGSCKKYEEQSNSVYIWTQSTEAYEGAVLDRHLLLTDGYLLDWFHVELEQKAEIDWWFHTVGKLTEVSAEEWQAIPEDSKEAELSVALNLTEPSGYEYIKLMKRMSMQSNSAKITSEAVSWLCGVMAPGLEQESAQISITALLSSTREAYEIESPGISIDPSTRCGGILLRERGRSADFITVYQDGSRPVTLSNFSSSDSVKRVTLTSEAGTRVVSLHPERGIE
jgi:hypothetical protein